MSEVIFQQNGITVKENHRGDVIGTEYCISDGFTSFTQSEMPELNYSSLKREIIKQVIDKKDYHSIPADENEDYYETTL